MPSARAKPKSIDDYLAVLSDDMRAALEKLRKNIRAAAPMAEERISNHIPAFRLNGRLLVAFGVAAGDPAAAARPKAPSLGSPPRPPPKRRPWPPASSFPTPITAGTPVFL